MTFLKVMIFSVAVLLAYTMFANILPQVQSDPPAEEVVDEGSLDLAGMAAWGERLFVGKGTCTLCHNDLGRAPDLLALDLSTTFVTRITEERYVGVAKSQEGAVAIEAYVRESLTLPSAYVVAGFGKKGTNDTVSPMPAADKAPVSLTLVEMNAVIAFLQDKAGSDITVPLPAADEAPAAEEDIEVDEEEEDEDAPAATAEAAIDKFICNACHDLMDSGGDVGPALAGIGERLDAAGLRAAILDPNADIAEGFEADMMPPDYGEQMRAGELELIVDYLMQLQDKS